MNAQNDMAPGDLRNQKQPPPKNQDMRDDVKTLLEKHYWKNPPKILNVTQTEMITDKEMSSDFDLN